MKLFVCETVRASGTILFDHCHLYKGDAIREAYDVFDGGDACCEENNGEEDDFVGLICPGGCKIKSPRIVEFKAERVRT